MAEPQSREEGMEGMGWGQAEAEVGRGRLGDTLIPGCSMEDELKRSTLGSGWILNIQGSILLWK